MSDSSDSIHLSQSLTLDLDLSSEVLSHSSIYIENKSRNISLNQSLSAFQNLMESSDSEVEADIIEDNDFIIPSVINTSVSEDSSLFDVDIAENIVKLSDETTSLHTVNSIIVKYWYDVTLFDVGEPYKALIDEISKYSPKDLDSQSVQNIFNQLDDIRTSIKSEEGIFLFFVSALKLYQAAIDPELFRNETFEQSAKKLASKTIESSAQIYGAKFAVIFSEAIKHEIGTKEFEENLSKMKAIKNKFISKESAELKNIAKFLLNNIMLYIDCAITNMIITDRLIATVNEFVLANTNLSYIENELNETFPNFRQAILVVIANESILSNSETMKEMVPSIPVNFIYFLLCIIKPDENMKEFIAYEKLDKFAKVNHCNFGIKCEEFLLKPKLLDLPEMC